MSKILEELEKMKREGVYKREQAVVDNFKRLMDNVKKSKKRLYKHLTVIK